MLLLVYVGIGESFRVRFDCASLQSACTRRLSILAWNALWGGALLFSYSCGHRNPFPYISTIIPLKPHPVFVQPTPNRVFRVSKRSSTEHLPRVGAAVT